MVDTVLTFLKKEGFTENDIPEIRRSTPIAAPFLQKCSIISYLKEGFSACAAEVLYDHYHSKGAAAVAINSFLARPMQVPSYATVVPPAPREDACLPTTYLEPQNIVPTKILQRVPQTTLETSDALFRPGVAEVVPTEPAPAAISHDISHAKKSLNYTAMNERFRSKQQDSNNVHTTPTCTIHEPIKAKGQAVTCYFSVEPETKELEKNEKEVKEEEVKVEEEKKEESKAENKEISEDEHSEEASAPESSDDDLPRRRTCHSDDEEEKPKKIYKKRLAEETKEKKEEKKPEEKNDEKEEPEKKKVEEKEEKDEHPEEEEKKVVEEENNVMDEAENEKKAEELEKKKSQSVLEKTKQREGSDPWGIHEKHEPTEGELTRAYVTLLQMFKHMVELKSSKSYLREAFWFEYRKKIVPTLDVLMYNVDLKQLLTKPPAIYLETFSFGLHLRNGSLKDTVCGVFATSSLLVGHSFIIAGAMLKDHDFGNWMRKNLPLTSSVTTMLRHALLDTRSPQSSPFVDAIQDCTTMVQAVKRLCTGVDAEWTANNLEFPGEKKTGLLSHYFALGRENQTYQQCVSIEGFVPYNEIMKPFYEARDKDPTLSLPSIYYCTSLKKSKTKSYQIRFRVDDNYTAEGTIIALCSRPLYDHLEGMIAPISINKVLAIAGKVARRDAPKKFPHH